MVVPLGCIAIDGRWQQGDLRSFAEKDKNYNQTTPLQNNLLIFAAENKTIKSDYDDAMNDCDWYQTIDEH